MARKVYLSHDGDDARATLVELGRGDSVFYEGPVAEGDIDDANLDAETIAQRIRQEYLRDSTVTVVLVGQQTFRHKHVDWEISSSLRGTARSGLLGILAPSYRIPEDGVDVHEKSSLAGPWWRYNVPPRLWDQVAASYAAIREWPRSPEQLRVWIEEAHARRLVEPRPNLSRRPFGADLADFSRWRD